MYIDNTDKEYFKIQSKNRSEGYNLSEFKKEQILLLNKNTLSYYTPSFTTNKISFTRNSDIISRLKSRARFQINNLLISDKPNTKNIYGFWNKNEKKR